MTLEQLSPGVLFTVLNDKSGEVYMRGSFSEPHLIRAHQIFPGAALHEMLFSVEVKQVYITDITIAEVE